MGYDLHGPSHFKRLASAVATQFASGETYVDRVIIGAALASTDQVVLYDGASTTTSGLAHIAIGPRGGLINTAHASGSIEIGAAFNLGLVVHCTSAKEVAVVLKNEDLQANA